MIGKVKKWLGIEGVKLELILPDIVPQSSGIIRGKVRFTSKNAQKISHLSLVVVERYARGRNEDKLVDEYELGRTELDMDLEVMEGKSVELDIHVRFEIAESEMDALERKNVLTSVAVKGLKYFEGVQSNYAVIAEAKVAGVGLNPFDKREIELV